MKYRKRTWKKYFKKHVEFEHTGATVIRLIRKKPRCWECDWRIDEWCVYERFYQQDFLERR